MRPFYQAPYYSVPAPIRPVNPGFFQANPFTRVPPNIPIPQQGIPGGRGFQGFQGFQGQGIPGSQGFQGQGIPGSQSFQDFQGIPGTAAATAAAAAGATPFRLDQFMNQAGQFVQSAQKYAPMIQQARPMLKNLPALWRIYKGFNSTSSAGEKQAVRSSRAQERSEESRSSRSSTRSTINEETRPSIPKIYQPKFENFQ